jgi:hypothetical protein
LGFDPSAAALQEAQHNTQRSSQPVVLKVLRCYLGASATQGEQKHTLST